MASIGNRRETHIMKTIQLLIAGLLCLSPVPFASSPSEPLSVVTTIPDIADVLERIGGDRVSVKSITKGRENLHAVTARPSHIVALNRAEMFVQIGLSLEAAFAPGMLEGARNKSILPGAPGFVNLSDGWEALDVPVTINRKGGDVHPHGNPHMNLDPRAGRHMSKRILEALIRLQPDSKAYFEQRAVAYGLELDVAEKRWAKATESLRGKMVVVYHQEYLYLAAFHGIEIVDSIESRPGIPPTPNHLAQLITNMRDQQVRVILTAPWSNNRDVSRVCEATGAKALELPNQAGGTDSTKTWIGMMDSIHQSLDAAFTGSDSK
jgi:zinc/manganese transport system substrate-binding protein